jgi:CheY-like chemotaxis protein
MAELLGDQGFEVVTATGGREALRRLGDPAFRPCLILLDSSMPDMTGRAFLAEREKNPELAPIPIIVVSGDHRLLQGSAASLQVDDCLLKPVPADLLIDSVRRHCGRDRSSPVAT